MDKLNKKEIAFVTVGYLVFSVIFSFANFNWYALIYFGAIALIIAFSDKIFGKISSVMPTPIAVALVAAISHRSLYRIFAEEHIIAQQILTAFAVAFFIAGIFAVVNKHSLPFAAVCAPVLCALNLRIAFSYCIFLIFTCALNLYRQKNVKNSEKVARENKINIFAIVMGVVFFAVCVFMIVKTENHISENFTYYKKFFKGNIAVIISAVYLLVALVKSKCETRALAAVGTAVFTAAAIVSKFFLGWATFSLTFICAAVFLLYCSAKSDTALKRIKTDYRENSYIFWVLAVCLFL